MELVAPGILRPLCAHEYCGWGLPLATQVNDTGEERDTDTLAGGRVMAGTTGKLIVNYRGLIHFLSLGAYKGLQYTLS